MSRELSPKLLGFLAEAIHSVEQLEILLLLRASRDAPSLTADEISSRLRSNAESVRSRLVVLVSNGLVVEHPPGAFRFEPANETLAAQVEELAEAYASRRFTIINTIHDGRKDPLREFADA